MQSPSYIALSRQTALWRQMDVVANNIANMNTPGFKTESMVFTDYLMRSRGTEGPWSDTVAYTLDLGTHRDLSVGPMQETGNPLDLAINGRGYLEIETDFGRFYTRNGRLMLDADGMIVTGAGHPVMSTEDTPFFIAPNENTITVSRNGTVSTENGDIGRLRVVSFEDEQSLLRVEDGVYDAGEQEPEEIADAAIQQGMLEGSNVEATQQITHMIEVQRAYEAVQKMIETESQRQRQAMKVLSGAQNA
jgi:flagellar basal-body rod protein FlgF